MLRNPDTILPEDIALYAMNATHVMDNDHFRTICDLIVAYGESMIRLTTEKEDSKNG